jgi:hypothetical protein
MNLFPHLLMASAFLLAAGTARAEEVAKVAEPEISVEEYLQKLSTVPGVVGRKDPFVKFGPPFEIPPPPEEDRANLGAPVLERYPLTKYSVVATLLGDQYPRALVRLPPEEKGQVLIVKEKDKMGNKSGLVSKITQDGIVVSEKRKSAVGKLQQEDVVIRISGGSAKK